MYLVQEGVLFKCLTGILAVSTLWGAGSVLKYSNGLLSLLPMKRSQKFEDAITKIIPQLC